jgi:hypothetical protein
MPLQLVVITPGKQEIKKSRRIAYLMSHNLRSYSLSRAALAWPMLLLLNVHLHKRNIHEEGLSESRECCHHNECICSSELYLSFCAVFTGGRAKVLVDPSARAMSAPNKRDAPARMPHTALASGATVLSDFMIVAVCEPKVFTPASGVDGRKPWAAFTANARVASFKVGCMMRCEM